MAKDAKRIEVISRGLVSDGFRVLVCAPKDGSYCYLPGGHVEPGEASHDALRREFAEECGLEVEVGNVIGVSEERFVQRGRTRHEINIVFLVKLPISAADVVSKEPDILFRLIALQDAAEMNLLPRSFSLRLASFHEKHPALWLGSNVSID